MKVKSKLMSAPVIGQRQAINAEYRAQNIIAVLADAPHESLLTNKPALDNVSSSASMPEARIFKSSRSHPYGKYHHTNTILSPYGDSMVICMVICKWHHHIPKKSVILRNKIRVDFMVNEPHYK